MSADLVEFRTTPPAPPAPPARRRRPSRALVVRGTSLLVALAAVVAVLLAGGEDGAGPSGDARAVLAVFVVAVWAWAFTEVDDTYVALGAACTVVLLGAVSTEGLFATLGDDTIWLLVAAFVVAAGTARSGLAMRACAWLVTGARTPRQLVHLVTAATVVTTFAVPSTSGRAALTLPVLVALATVLQHERYGGRHDRLVRALSLLLPTVILLSAVGSLLGAGAHLVTASVVQTATGAGFTFATWLVLGLPLAVVSSHLAAELVLRQQTRREDRRESLEIGWEAFEDASPTPVRGPLTLAEHRALTLLVGAVGLWCTEAVHGIHPALVALVAALVTTSPRYGSTTLGKGLKTVPWSLLLFMAATLALGDALIRTGAAQWVADALVGALDLRTAVPFVVVVVVLSTAAHLLVQSRSARSAVLVPVVVALAPTVGVSAAAVAFASTAAAGFCHTLTTSAKPVALFASVAGVPTYGPADLRRLSLVLAPLHVALVLLFTFAVWPLLGLPL